MSYLRLPGQTLAKSGRLPKDAEGIEKTVYDELQAGGLLGTTWAKSIIDATKRGWFSSSEHMRAGSWATCACGLLLAPIKVDHIGKPLDGQLAQQGAAFCHAVNSGRFIAAAVSLCRIEARAIELTQQHGITQEANTD